MEIEFDPAKDAVNRDKHGVSLAFGARVFDDTECLTLPSIRAIDSEDRSKAIGQVEGRLWTAVYVMRGAIVRLISVRKSNDGESRLYHRP